MYFTSFSKNTREARQISMTSTADRKYSSALSMMLPVATELMIRANEENKPAQAYVYIYICKS